MDEKMEIQPSYHVLPGNDDIVKRIGVPVSVVVRPFLYDVTNVYIPFLKIPKCQHCAAYFSPVTHWICPHTRYFCHVCHSFVPDQQNRFIEKDQRRERIPELEENTVQYVCGVDERDFVFRRVVICDNTVLSSIGQYIKTITEPFLLVLCSDQISVIQKNKKSYYEFVLCNVELSSYSQLESEEESIAFESKKTTFLHPSKTLKIAEWCHYYTFPVFNKYNGKYIYKQALLYALKMIQKYGVVDCFHGVNSQYFDFGDIKQISEFQKIGHYAQKYGIMINNYFIGNELRKLNIPIATTLATLTNGSTFFAKTFDENYLKSIKKNIVGVLGHVKLRTPDGMEVLGVFGSSIGERVDCGKIGVLTDDVACLFECAHFDEVLKIKHQFQCVLTYTGLDGRKCVRVMNSAVYASDTLSACLDINNINFDVVVVSLLSKLGREVEQSKDIEIAIQHMETELRAMSFICQQQIIDIMHKIFASLKSESGAMLGVILSYLTKGRPDVVFSFKEGNVQ
ncbi:hypothetical protein EIN_418610 [Entamoeba invadens IP1]|uniref:Uncharacterized protein n=1 Tax=Entamoeba invadens IP1 TaxID=370355 RepID=A0A0A1U536_ENTIV|nr:hypothetical protein EIN_418610 [Entamoeba invadens IP1]ELP87982.1 hypothetical protein EIN_418610 [Entamoeba invadens IP1]|eukprot:XP_004254753.1 hypothetical protein EIN_418610 [Entamoeba invadens IP1]